MGEKISHGICLDCKAAEGFPHPPEKIPDYYRKLKQSTVKIVCACCETVLHDPKAKRYRRNAFIDNDGRGHLHGRHLPEKYLTMIEAGQLILEDPLWVQGMLHGSGCEGACCVFNVPEYYHVMFTNRLESVLRQGIQPNQYPVWPEQTEAGYIYAFADIRDALRWCFKVSVEPGMSGMSLSVVGFVSDDNWEPDPNQPMLLPGYNEGGWWRLDDYVDPSDFSMLLHVNQPRENPDETEMAFCINCNRQFPADDAFD